MAREHVDVVLDVDADFKDGRIFKERFESANSLRERDLLLLPFEGGIAQR
jgi:hypothetical protein